MSYLKVKQITGKQISDDFIVFNLDTGKEEHRCQWANDETGEYGILNENLSIIKKKNNIILVYKGE